MTALDPTLGTRLLLAHAASLGELRRHPGRALLSALGIALGVALGVAVHIINSSAINEFSISVNAISGDADLVVRGPRAGFSEDVFPRVASLPGVEAVSPAVEADAKLVGRRESLRLLGLDLLRARQVQPALVADLGVSIIDLFDPDAVLLTPKAASDLELEPGDALVIQVGSQEVRLEVAGLLAPGAFSQRLTLMDIGAAQWRLQRVGSLNRIDIRARSGTDLDALKTALERMLPAGVQVTIPDAEARRGASLSRAYRVNLDMLALVALFTGGFLVFATQALAILRRRQHLALLRVLGATPRQLLRLLLAEGAVIGVVGSLGGLALGYGLAALALTRLGGDLGAGYFQGIAARPHVDPVTLCVFFSLGIAAALAGAALPAWEAARTPPAPALKAGSQELATGRLRSPATGIALIAAGALLVLLPPVAGLPLPGYAAITLMLLGAVWLTPSITNRVLGSLPLPRAPSARLAVAQLRGASGLAGASVAGIVFSFSLMVAMAIMVWSFRQSLDAWLTKVLPADVYVRAGFGDTAFFSAADQAKLRETPGAAKVEFQRQLPVLLDPRHPAVVVIARAMDPGRAEKALPLIAKPVAPPSPDLDPVWVSEAVADLYGVAPGQRIDLPLGSVNHAFAVAGIWRDYARQSGAVIMDRAAYVRHTGDAAANDAALWLAPGATLDDVSAHLRSQFGTSVEIVQPAVIRRLSLRTFDRTFLITYALEAVAVLIGLFGISVSFSAQAIARRAEFAMLRHVGMTRREIGAMLGIEGAVLGAVGVALGLVVGFAVSLILIHVVNRQSFHWSMDLHVPLLLLPILAAVLVVTAALTATWSGRHALGNDVLRAVREDW